MHTDAITAHLAKADVLPVMTWLQSWLLGATYTDIQGLVSGCPAPTRPRLVVLIRDLLATYPSITWGLPVLLHVAGGRMTLPVPERSPDPDVLSFAWLSLDLLGKDEAFQPRGGGLVGIERDKTVCVVLLAKTQSPAPPTLTDGMWWSELLAAPDEHSIRCTAGSPMPWPDAMECGVDLLAAATQGATNAALQRVFLSDADWIFALDTGLKWRESQVSQS